jgi:hypothetical protein
LARPAAIHGGGVSAQSAAPRAARAYMELDAGAYEPSAMSNKGYTWAMSKVRLYQPPPPPTPPTQTNSRVTLSATAQHTVRPFTAKHEDMQDYQSYIWEGICGANDPDHPPGCKGTTFCASLRPRDRSQFSAALLLTKMRLSDEVYDDPDVLDKWTYAHDRPYDFQFIWVCPLPCKRFTETPHLWESHQGDTRKPGGEPCADCGCPAPRFSGLQVEEQLYEPQLAKALRACATEKQLRDEAAAVARADRGLKRHAAAAGLPDDAEASDDDEDGEGGEDAAAGAVSADGKQAKPTHHNNCCQLGTAVCKSRRWRQKGFETVHGTGTWEAYTKEKKKKNDAKSYQLQKQARSLWNPTRVSAVPGSG